MASPKATSSPERTEKLAVLLSLPRQNKYNTLPAVERPAGLPINALPGWESIPLYSKLPMLKCPDNHVIFSKNKIGRSFETWQRDFDSVCRNSKMDYNPLHDRHLRRFYSNEKLLKRLRENGEITQNNDVICTLKEFNEHRLPLHETYLSLLRMERNRLYDEKNDKQMITHAEKIAEHDRRIINGQAKGMKNVQEIIRRKEELRRQYAQRVQTLRVNAQRKQQQIEAMKSIKEMVLRHKKELHGFKIKHCLDVSIDIKRKRLIALKKNLTFKADRLKNNIKLIQENCNKQAKEKARQSWERHLKERITKHEHVKRILKENEREMKHWTEQHMATYQQKWDKIQTELAIRSRRHLEKRPRQKYLAKKIRRSLDKSEDHDLKNLTSQDIHDALQTALDMENPQEDNESDVEEYIFKAAKYILEDILAKFDKDLSGKKYAETVLSHRISRLFSDVKQNVIKRASQIIASGTSIDYSRTINDNKRLSMMSTRTRRYSLLKFVSFNSLTALIGKGSYALNEGNMKSTAERTPTPAGSLTSVVIDGDNYEHIRRSRPILEQLTRDEQIFIEHLFIKFKRQLIVGIGRQVLTAIECHRNNKILNVRKELQDIDNQFLVKIMARSILSYAINCCNFHSNSLLCQHALAGDIIFSLQKGLLKPIRDPRVIAQPRSRCVCPVVPPFSTHCKQML